jgi:phosphatidylinositol 4-kinase
MLIQRLQISEPYAEAAIAHNLVDLALKAPESSFLDVIKAFSSLSLTKYSEDPRFSNNMVKPPLSLAGFVLELSTDFGCTD